MTYKDDKNIEKGENISDQLIESIQDSRFHIIVFSKNYASSSWCLEELVKIMECHKTKKQTAYPIFYDVEPTEVRKQSGTVGEAFKEQVKKEGAQRWRDALKEASDVAGMELESTGDGHEVQFIQKVVDDISRKKHFDNFSFSDKLVGMETRVEKVYKSLESGFGDVQVIGIKGIGGGGKTTLARAIFENISTEFEGKSFVENVRERSKGGFGLKDLQKQILQDVSNGQIFDVKTVFEGENWLKRYLGSRKVLIVLDDVDNVGQLRALADEPTWFKAGSIIIITTRDKHVLDAHNVNNIHDIDLLSNPEAISLFHRHAFKGESPRQGFEELSAKVVHYAAGLPLTINVLGSFLCKRTKHEWEKIIERLEKIPLKETLEKLELSYNGLEDDYKEIFLDVVCMLKGEMRHEALVILESCGYHADVGLTVLEEKCLISFQHGFLHLHDHIEEMGRNIVRRLHPEEPNKHTRLWIEKEIEDILVDDSGTKATRSLKLEYTKLHAGILMKGLRKMKKLRFLYLAPDGMDDTTIIEESNEYLPNSLQYLYWPLYPFRCLPKSFQANKLVNLDMSYSKISQLWEGEETKVFSSLRFLCLDKTDMRTLDLGMTPNLEFLRLYGCEDFVKLEVSDECPHLELLDLEGCSNLAELHMHVELPWLKVLNLSCSKLSNLNLGLTPNLEELVLDDCEEFVELVIPTVCSKLETLILTRSKARKLNLKQTPNLIQLLLLGNYELVELEMPDECLKLEAFDLHGSKVSRYGFFWAPRLTRLSIYVCDYLKEIVISEGCLELVEHDLDLSHWSMFEFLRETPLELPLATALELTEWPIDGCPLHPTNRMMPQVQYTVSVDRLVSSTGNPEKVICLLKCVCLHMNFDSLSKFASEIDMQRSRMLISENTSSQKVLPEELCQLKSIERLNLTTDEINLLPNSICMLNHLKHLEFSSCSRLERLPEDLDRLECLEELIIKDCGELRAIPDNVCNMKSLKRLCLLDCDERIKLPAELGRLECLKELNVEGTDLPYLPRSIYQLKGLRIIGSRMQLESYGVTSLIELSESNAFGYIEEPPFAVQPWLGRKALILQLRTGEDSSRPTKISRS